MINQFSSLISQNY